MRQKKVGILWVLSYWTNSHADSICTHYNTCFDYLYFTETFESLSIEASRIAHECFLLSLFKYCDIYLLKTDLVHLWFLLDKKNQNSFRWKEISKTSSGRRVGWMHHSNFKPCQHFWYFHSWSLRKKRVYFKRFPFKKTICRIYCSISSELFCQQEWLRK